MSPGANVMDKGRSQGLTWTEATCWLGTTSSGMITTSVDKKGSLGSGPAPTWLSADHKPSSGCSLPKPSLNLSTIKTPHYNSL